MSAETHILLKRLASLKLTVIGLFLLAVLVFWGTLYQVQFGLYAAQQRFYNSWIVMVMGAIPFPGAQLVLFVLFFNLLASMLVQIRYGWRHTGVLLIHAGVLVLLGGGYVTHLHAQESFLTLEEGQSSNLSSSYHAWELAVWREGSEPEREVWAIDADNLGQQAVQVGPLRIVAERLYPNARAFIGGETGGSLPRNASGITSLEPAPTKSDPAENLPGGIFSVSTDGGVPERITLFGGEERAATVASGETAWAVRLRRKQFPLPLDLKLIDFRRELHPNSEMAKSYSSLVQVDTESGSRQALIEMNQPLRYRGHTLFQSSFSILDDQRETSTFAIVRNRGRLLPYVASIVTFLGLALHFGLQFRPARKNGGLE